MKVKFELNVNGVIEERADHGHVDTTDVQESRCATEENNKRQRVDIYEALGCDKKNADVPEEVTLAKHFT